MGITAPLASFPSSPRTQPFSRRSRLCRGLASINKANMHVSPFTRYGSDCPQCTRTKRKRPANRGAPKLQSSDLHAAILAALPSRTFLAVVMGIARGFIASGTTRKRSTCRSPFSRLAPLTLT